MMITHRRIQVRPAGALAAALVLAGCTALTRDVLVKESAHPKPAVVSHCSGSEWMDNSMIAVVPIPIVAFASPTQELNDITTDDVLKRCGPPERLANRHVEVNRGLCVPLTLTRLITLGVWHWCPADVSYDADATAPAPAVANMRPAIQNQIQNQAQPEPSYGGVARARCRRLTRRKGRFSGALPAAAR